MQLRRLASVGIVAIGLTATAPAWAQSQPGGCPDGSNNDTLCELVLTAEQIAEIENRSTALQGPREGGDALGDLIVTIGEAADAAGVLPAGLVAGEDGFVKRDDVLVALLDNRLDFPQVKDLTEQGKLKPADFHIINIILQSSPADYTRIQRTPLPFDPRPRILAGDPSYPIVKDIEITSKGLRVLKAKPDGTLRLTTYAVGKAPVDQDIRMTGQITNATLVQADGTGGHELFLETVADGERKAFAMKENEHGYIASVAYSVTAEAGDTTSYEDLLLDEYILADLEADPEPERELTPLEEGYFQFVEVQELMIKQAHGEDAEMHFFDYGNDNIPDAFVRTGNGIFFIPAGDSTRTLSWDVTELDPPPGSPPDTPPTPARLGRVLHVGDVNGDGVADFAFTSEPEGSPHDVWIFYGKPPKAPVVAPSAPDAG